MGYDTGYTRSHGSRSDIGGASRVEAWDKLARISNKRMFIIRTHTHPQRTRQREREAQRNREICMLFRSGLGLPLGVACLLPLEAHAAVDHLRWSQRHLAVDGLTRLSTTCA